MSATSGSYVTGTVPSLTLPRDGAERIAERLRQLGVERIVYGSDMAIRGCQQPRQAWAMFRGLLPLTDAEFAVIAANRAPCMR